jgi:hypothetical protein
VSVLAADGVRQAFGGGAFLRVVNWHNTPVPERSTLRAELAWYLDRFDPVLPEHLDRFFDTGEWPLRRPGFVAAFYDGYLNNATVAAPVCDELGLPAWFFPPTTFLSVEPEHQREYADAHDIDLVDEERHQPALAMTWDHLAAISARHVVGAHTANHVEARHVRTAEDAEREVLGPVRRIEALTGRRPPAFAWLWGAPFDGASVAGQALLQAGVRYAFSNTVIQRIAD